jgi:hypothetical protein
MIIDIEPEKLKYCDNVKMNRDIYSKNERIKNRTNGIFGTFARTLVGRAGLDPANNRKEASFLSDFVYQEIIDPILTTYEKILTSQAEFDLWHRRLTHRMIEKCPISWNTGKNLTIGMSQKIINLHCKDIWAINLIPIDYSQHFHVVIDRISLNIIGKNDFSWTHINNYIIYFDFQTAFRKFAEIRNQSPLAIECQYWNMSTQKE